MATDPYATLGVSRNSSDEDIHRAYRDLARKYHPDLNPDDAAATKKFQEIQGAYEILKDPEKRQMFDRYGPDFEAMRGGGGPGGGGGPFRGRPGGGPSGGNPFSEADFRDMFGEGSESGGFADLFRQFTGRSGRRSTTGSGRGKDIRHDLQIAFRTAVSGGSAQLSVRRQNGKVETIDVKIPPGIDSGKKIRLRGQGDPGPTGGQAGDILITVQVAPHPAYTRAGLDLVARVPVTLNEALLGAKVDLPTPKGTITLTVPPGTSSGKRLRVKGHGVTTKDRQGDLYAEIHIVLPENLDEATKQKIRDLDLPETPSPRNNLRW